MYLDGSSKRPRRNAVVQPNTLHASTHVRDSGSQTQRIVLTGELPTGQSPSGCGFRTRCPVVSNAHDDWPTCGGRAPPFVSCSPSSAPERPPPPPRVSPHPIEFTASTNGHADVPGVRVACIRPSLPV